MKVSVNWLKELCPVAADATEIARRLTGAGLEVEGVSHVGGFAGVIVAEVKEKRPHPKADKLTLVDVWDGRAVTQVVCGAQNIPGAGGKVAWARPGAKLPDGRVLEPREVRGVISPGMLCAEDELGLGTSHEGILHLDASLAPDTDVAAALGLPDTIFELNVTPNRPDCLGHVGVARELSVLFGVPLRFPSAGSGGLADLAAISSDEPAASLAAVEITDIEGCPRYLARVLTGVRVAPSPLPLRLRLQSLGLRAINNVVDATNLVLLETGHPLHAFDLDRLAGHRIVVRRARDDEPIRTLDGQDRKLTTDDVTICDAEQPVAVAGVMGGGDSEVSNTTTRILLESAYFQPARIRRTAKRLGLRSEASHRFERGTDPNAGVSLSSLSCAKMIAKMSGGRIAAGAIDVYPRPIEPVSLTLRPSRTDAVLGLAVPAPEQARTLEALGLSPRHEGDSITCRVPTFRPDLTREIDLVEEIARVRGYDGIPATIPRLSSVARTRLDPRPEAARDALAALGFSEAITYAFVGPDRIGALLPEGRRATPIRVENPLREEQSALRTSLLPGLLAALQRNAAHGTSDQRLFEVGTVFLPSVKPSPTASPLPSHLHPRGRDEALPEERRGVAGVLAGRREGGGASWLKPGEELDFFDVKAVVESLAEALRIAGARFRAAAPGEAPHLHPGLAAVIETERGLSGTLGEVHPSVRDRFGIESRAFAFELDLDALGTPAPIAAREVPRHPGSARDLSFFVARAIPSTELAAVMRAASDLVESVRPLDDYREPGRVPADKKGMLWSIHYRSPGRTLTDEDLTRAHAKVVAALAQRFAIETR